MSKNIYQKSSFGWWVLGGVIVVGLFLLGRGGGSTSKTNREVAITCTTDMATRFHIHTHLQILINGQQQEIPANIGISLGCMHPIHTHDATGTLHVESPEPRDFTLADFFAVWGKTFNQNQILDYKTDGSHIIKVTVDGASIETHENTVLRDNYQIIISYETKK